MNKYRIIKIFIFVFFVLVALLYNLIFSPYFVNGYLKSIIRENLKDVQIDYDCKEISLLFGLEIDHIHLFDKVTKTPILELKKFKLKYFLPGFLNGDIGIRELTLLEPKIYLIKTNDRWNYESLIPTTQQQEEVQQESPLEDVIHLYVPLRLFFYFNIQKLNLVYKDIKLNQENAKEMIKEQLELRDFSLFVGFITKVFDQIPLNYKLFNLIDKFVFSINPKEPLFLTYQKNWELTGQPIVQLKVSKVHSQNDFISKILIDTNLIKFSQYGQNITFESQFMWNIHYVPEKKLFEIQEISFKNQNNYLFFLKGKFFSTEKDWYLELEQQQDNPFNFFSLSSFGQLLSLLTENKMLLDGRIKIKELVLKGNLTDLNTKINIDIPYFRFNEHNIKALSFNSYGNLDLSQNLSFLYDNPPKKPNLAFGLVKNFNINNLSLYYNNAYLKLTGNIQEQVIAELNIEGLHLGNFLYPNLQGVLNGILRVQSDNNFSKMQLFGDINLNNTIYSVENYFSRNQNLFLKLEGNIWNSDVLKIDLKVNELSAKTPNNQTIIFIKGKTSLNFGNFQNYWINLETFDVDYQNLIDRIPANLKVSLIAFKEILNKGMKINGIIDLTLSNENIYKTNLNLLLPSMHPSPINIDVDINQSQNFVNFNKVSIMGWYNTLILKLKGNLINEKNHWIPDLKMFLHYQNPNITEIYKNVFLKGQILLDLKYQKETIEGKLNINNLSLKYILDCNSTNKDLCTYYEIEDINLNLPFFHRLNQQSFVTYQQYEELYKTDANFTIKSIKSNYSLDNTYYENSFYFLGSKNKNAVEGFFEYKNNILWIPFLKLYSFVNDHSNGDIELKNFYFNLSDLKPENMSLYGKFFLLNYDLNALFPKAEGVFKGNVSGFVFFKINPLSDIIRNMDIHASIYQFSKDFAGFAVRIVAPTIVASVVNRSLQIEGIDLELYQGNVYSTIKVKSPGFFSLSKLIRPLEEEIKKERIPLAEFLKRSQQEIKMVAE